MPAFSREELAARLTEIAYRAILEQGLQRPFVEVELDLWRRIRSAFLDDARALVGDKR